MKKKKSAFLFLSVILAVVLFTPWSVAADERDEKELESVSGTEQITDIFEGLPENHQLFQGYVSQLFFDSYSVTPLGDCGESRLDGVDLAAYHILKEKLGKIASGEISSSKITVSLEDLGISQTEWTAADLGLGQINQETFETAATALREQITPSLHTIFRYLLVDCPYDLYWFNKSSGGVAVKGWSISGSTLNGEDYTISVSSNLEYSFIVAEEYQDESAENPSLTVNAALIRTANEASENAKKIVKKYAGYSDHDKLEGYRKEICELVSYNYDAADTPGTPYGNPWQLIWVFDEDPDTNVVCEGYSKAFQYLCDLSDFFSPNIRCYTVTGTMDGGTGAGPHMWNIVTMDDGKNYMVDVTNCDGDSEEAQDRLFLVGADGSVADHYAVVIENGYVTQTITYEYSGKQEGDMSMVEMYGDILQISASDYEFSYVQSGRFGSDLEWTLDANGILNIKGSGDMPEPDDPTDYTVIPWYDYRGDIQRVVIEEGITSVASWAFLQITNISEIYLPKGLLRIGNASFAMSGVEQAELPDTLTSVGVLAFASCEDLKEMQIPASVTEIGAGAFMDCTALKDIWFLGACPAFLEGDEEAFSVFKGDTLTLHYPGAHQASWAEKAREGFLEAEVVFLASCRENEHIWAEEYTVDQAATCTQDGEKSIRCTICNKIKEKAVIPGGHNWEENYRTEKAATCKEKGIESIHCKNCDATKESREIPFAAHSLAKSGAGANEHYACRVCGKMFRDAAGTIVFVYSDTKEEIKEELSDKTVKVSGITIETDASGKIAAGKKVTLRANVAPENAANPEVIWESDNARYAVVNSKGIVTTKKAGKGKTVTITATAADGSGIKATFKIKLMANAVTKVKILNAKKTLKAGKTMKLRAAVSANGKKANKKVKWTSSNPNYATVNARGQVKAKPAGKNKTVTITAMATDGTKKKAKIKIRINAS